MSPHSNSDIMRMLGAELFFILLLVAMTYARKMVDSTVAEDMRSFAFNRAIESMHIMIAMTMSWLALYLFYWISAAMFTTIGQGFLEIISAAILTACALMGIIVLDQVADKVVELTGDGEDGESHVSPELGGASKKGEATIQLIANKPASPVSEAIQMEAFDSSNLEKAIRSIIDSISLSVGLAWEHAFHAAFEVVIEENAMLNEHRIFSKLGMATLSCWLMTPVWLKFIVPMAQKHWKQHQQMMLLARSQHL